MSEYHRAVGAYFDEDADEFDARYWANPVLQRVRQVFREEVKRLPFQAAFEVGTGTGLDLVHFATIYPERSFHGVDVSPKMIALTRARIDEKRLTNATAEVASADDAPSLAGPEAFELGYVFFGALNTVEDLGRTADRLYDALAPGGHLVLTFVNRWYLADILIGLLKGRPRQAFARVRPEWGGYSPDRHLPSRCPSPNQIRRAFGHGGRLRKTRGLSITYPAWYRTHWLKRLGRWSRVLWTVDEWLSRTPLWSTGEYALYVFQKRPEGRA